jgi:hypothetical protein
MSRIFIYISKLSGVYNSNLERFWAEFKRIEMKLRQRLMQAGSAQSLEMLISVAIADSVDVYNKRMAAGR